MIPYTAIFVAPGDIVIRTIDLEATGDMNAWKQAWIMETDINKDRDDDDKVVARIMDVSKKRRSPKNGKI